MLQQEEVGILSREENTLAITPSKKRGGFIFEGRPIFGAHIFGAR